MVTAVQDTAGRGVLAKAAAALHRLVRDASATFWMLAKIIVPVAIVTRVLEQMGAIEVLGRAMGPVMGLVGLPGSMGLVWAATLVTNLYGGVIALASLGPQTHLTVAQMTVLTTMMLVAHALPVELRVAQKAGPRMRFTALWRLGGALLLGYLLNEIYHWGGWLQTPNHALWTPATQAPPEGWGPWALDQLRNLAWIFCAIFALMLLLRVLGRLGVTDAISRLLAPMLRVLGMTEQAAPLTVVGMTLGIGYGGGLIIQEARRGHLSPRDIFFSLATMGLTHSLIEDTLIMAMIGGHWSGIVLGRIVFTIAAVAVLVRVLARVPDAAFERYLCRRAMKVTAKAGEPRPIVQEAPREALSECANG